MSKTTLYIRQLNGFLLAMSIIVLAGCSQKSLIEYPEFSSNRGVALNGYDVIAYYDIEDDQSAVKGIPNFRVEYQGTYWQFSNAINAGEFAGAPKEYLPMYNGYAADRLSFNGTLQESNPRYWAFFDNDLYLFRTWGGLNRWRNGDWHALKAIADENFEIFIVLKKGNR